MPTATERIDLAEARTAMPRLAEKFSTVDADNDGKVTADELQVASPPLSCGRSPPGAGPRYFGYQCGTSTAFPKPGTRHDLRADCYRRLSVLSARLRGDLRGRVIDPEVSQIDRYLGLAARDGLRIRYLIDTHTHADHFSATRHLAGSSACPW